MRIEIKIYITKLCNKSTKNLKREGEKKRELININCGAKIKTFFLFALNINTVNPQNKKQNYENKERERERERERS